MKLFYLVISTLFFSSCAYHTGSIESDVSLTSSNYQVVDFASGTVKTTKVLGVGGLNNSTLIFEAKKNLYSNYSLDKGQVLANPVLDINRKFFLLFSSTRVTITAEVVQLDVDSANRLSTRAMSAMNASEESLNYSFEIGEEVGFMSFNFEKAVIKKIEGNKAILDPLDSEKDERSVSLNLVYKTKKDPTNRSKYGREIDDIVRYKFIDKNRGAISADIEIRGPAKIIALNTRTVIVEHEDGKTDKVKYEHILD